MLTIRRRFTVAALTRASVLSLTLAVVGLNAQDPDDPLELPPTVITATRTAVPAATIGSAVTVLSAETLHEMQVDTVVEALRRVPGIAITQQGGPGQLSSVFLRGHNAAQTKILIDGVRLNSNIGGSYDISNLPLTNVDRIEIVRGPQSALYGSDAIGGVINIITRRGAQGLHGSIEGAAGNADYRTGSAGLAGGNDLGDFNVAFGYRQFGGISAAAERLGNSEDDSWQQHGGTGRFGLNFLDDGRLDLTLHYTDDDADLDGYDFFAGAPSDDLNYTKTRQAYGGRLELAKPISDWYTQRFAYGLRQEKLTFINPDDFFPYSESRETTHYFSALSELTPIADHTLTIGYDYEKQQAAIRETGIDESLDIHSLFIQDHWVQSEVLALTAGIRYDDHQTFGSETTFRLAASATIPDRGTRFHATFGTGFRAPTLSDLNDLYFPGSSNPDLGPESSVSLDFGVEQAFLGRALVLDLTYFKSSVEDLIQWVVTRPENIAEADIEGFEATLQAQPLPALQLDATFTYTDATDSDSGLQLPRRPKTRASLSANYQFIDAANLQVSVLRVGSRYDDAFNQNVLDAYSRVDVAVTYEISDQIEVFGRVENVFDQYYEEVLNYTTPGRWGFAGLRCRF